MQRTLLAVAAAAVAAVMAVPTAVPAAAPARPAVAGDALPLVRVRVPDARTAAYVANNFDESHEHHPGHVEIVLWPGDAARLRELGLDWTVVVPDLRASAEESRGDAGVLVELPGPDRTDYRRLPDYEAELKALAKKHPSFIRLVTLPNKTLEGRTVYGVEIARHVSAKDGRPTFLVDGVHHAREWPAGEYPMIYAHRLAEGYGRNAAITKLLGKVRIVIVPIVNPDGFDYSREAPVDGTSLVGQAAYWRKNRRSITGVTAPEPVGFNPDAYGVDPNRNYGYMWGDDIGGSSEVPVEENHRGSAAFSEPESRNIEKLLLGRPVTALVTNHTSGRLVMHPWGFTDDETPTSDEKIFDAVGERLADAMGGYQNWSAIELYPTSGGSRDWAYGALGTLTYTFEHGTSFHPPYAEGIRIWADVMRAFDIAANAAADPRKHSLLTGTVTRGGRRVPATLTLTKTVVNPLWPDNPSGVEKITEKVSQRMVAGRDGAFAWHVNPSVRPWQAGASRETYTLTVTYGGRSRTVKVLARRGQVVRLGTIRL
jgi:murein tripeptide amidase MpaA